MTENDADKRPRVYLHSAMSEQEIEVTVQGSEGETTDDVEEKAKRLFRMMKENPDDEVTETYE